MCDLHHCKKQSSLLLSYELYDRATNKKDFDYWFEVCKDCLKNEWKGDERKVEKYLEEVAELSGYYAVLKSNIKINVEFRDFMEDFMGEYRRSMDSILFSISHLFPYLIFPPLFLLLPFYTLLLLFPHLKQAF